jgi:hypothetical protein
VAISTFGLDLLEAVDDGRRAELGAPARPRPPDARAREERHDLSRGTFGMYAG